MIIVKKIVPHLAKVMDINRPFFLLQQRFNAVFEVLDKFKLGVFILDRHAHLVIKNEYAYRILEKGEFVRETKSGKFVLQEEPSRNALDRFTARSFAGSGNAEKSLCLAYPHQSTDPSYMVEISTMDSSYSNDTLFLAICTDISHSEIVDISGVSQVFDLSQSESNIAQHIVNGLTNNEIAEARNSSAETVKSQIKAIFNKSGIHRRSDLISLAHKLKIPVVKSISQR